MNHARFIRRPLLICVIVAAFFFASSSAFASDLVEGGDPRAQPIKKALADVVEQIEAGDFDKAKAIYAGQGADLELLKAYVDGVAAAKAMRAEMNAKFGDQMKDDPPGLDEDVSHMRLNDLNSVVFLDDPDRASSSADSPLGVGIEFKKVAGKWEVLSLASEPNTPAKHLAILRKYTSTVTAITEKLKAGGYPNPDEALDAAAEAEGNLWPLTPATQPATEPAK